MDTYTGAAAQHTFTVNGIEFTGCPGGEWGGEYKDFTITVRLDEDVEDPADIVWEASLHWTDEHCEFTDSTWIEHVWSHEGPDTAAKTAMAVADIVLSNAEMLT